MKLLFRGCKYQQSSDFKKKNVAYKGKKENLAGDYKMANGKLYIVSKFLSSDKDETSLIFKFSLLLFKNKY